MPLIEKHVVEEGPDGSRIDRSYYVREKPANPYGDRARSAAARRGAAVRRVVNRRVVPHERGYMWTMGYNHCAGTYSPAGNFSRWSGSSMNRNKNLQYESKPDMAAAQRASIALARKVAKEYLQNRCCLPPVEITDFLMRKDQPSEERFRVWLRSCYDWPEDRISLPIYKLSPRSRGKIKDKATAFFRACPGERVFCTLTFIAPVADHTGIALLNNFLTTLRKEFPGLQYLWVAERQENGNIHFHMILNKRFSKPQLRKYNALWVLQQYRAGLEGTTMFGVPIPREKIESMYRAGEFGKAFPLNPLDVKRVRSIAGLSSYLTKYITKQADTFFHCLPWHCSRGVSKLFTRTVVSPSAFRYMTGLENCRVDKETGEVFIAQPVRPKGRGAAFCIMVYANRKDAPLRYLREMETINKWLIKDGVFRGRIDELDEEILRRRYNQNLS